jgi:nitroreductase
MRWGPTANNSTPARFHFVVSEAAKARLEPLLAEGNRVKARTAPAVAIIAYDLDFPDSMEKLAPHAVGLKDRLRKNPSGLEKNAFRGGTLQGAYFIIAARALGLDCGPMGGFDNEAVDREFFAGTNIKSNFLCALGYGDGAALKPRAPRLSFDEACKIL